MQTGMGETEQKPSYLGRGELSVRVQAEDLLKLLESVHNRPDVVVGFQRALAYFVLLRLEPHQKKCREVCKTEIESTAPLHLAVAS